VPDCCGALPCRDHAGELAMIDAAVGSPVGEMVSDAMVAAQMEFFAGFVTEMKGSIRGLMSSTLVRGNEWSGDHSVQSSLRSARQISCAAAANRSSPPPEQAPLSSLRLAELLDGLLPPASSTRSRRPAARTASIPVSPSGTD
jgi:betaine-aldehyde dehydrogenase